MALEPSLKQLLEPDSDLMTMFKEKAPGTYRHCDTVAQLTDSICSEIKELDRDVLFPAAKLHDIGKTLFPAYFCENQQDDNVHDKLEAEVSFQYLSRHVSDGILLLLKEPSISKQVLEVVGQHHGNSPIRSLCKTDKDLKIYRYPSVPPRTLEACTLMICDVVEAATRSLFIKQKLEDIKQTVTNLIDVMVEDKQLDFLRIGELRVIRQVLCNEVESLYHKRIDYDEAKVADKE